MSLKVIGAGTYELDLRKGEEGILFPGREPPPVRFAPLPRHPADRNPFGLRAAGES